MNKFTYLILSLFLIPGLSLAQKDQQIEVAMNFVQAEAENWGLSSSDVENLAVAKYAYFEHNGVSTIYLNQTHKGIPIENAIINLSITKDGKVGFYRNQFIGDAKSKVNTSQASITPEQAINASAQELHVALTKRASLKQKIDEQTYIYEGVNLSKKDIKVGLLYSMNDDGELVLGWNMFLDMLHSMNKWDVNIDAVTGAVINKRNETLYCAYERMDYSKEEKNACNHVGHDHSKAKQSGKAVETTAGGLNGSYKAYTLPAESPSHGTHELAVDPGIMSSSPFGWHDTNGEVGNEYTVTRGNNVHAFADQDNDFNSGGDEPEGGTDLVFDYDHLTDMGGEFNLDPAVVNLFYANNMYHDILYLFGFNEANGNFQENNYGNGGAPSDPIIAREAVPDPESGAANWSNASFGSGPDGFEGSMNMGIWASTTSVFEITAPSQLEGPVTVGTSSAGDWGHNWTTDKIIVNSEVALARDGDLQSPTQCCGDIVNTSEVMGKVAMIDRGLCEFGTKSLNAQNAGAIGVIICNVAGVSGGDGDETIGMAPGADGFDVTIPAIFVGKSTCDRIKATIGTGVPVSVSMSTELQTGPSTFNSSFDNGVIFHEYGHGFNRRAVGSLNTEEQMGEGWSDFFAVAMTVEDGDTSADPRGVGTYVVGQGPEGRGIRRFPYSTDMTTSPYTYDMIKGVYDADGEAEPHGVGEVWAAVIWDIYWMMIDNYGFDLDWTNTESGTFKGMRLITDGINFVGPNPGFLDARDAIFAADEMNFDNIHNCELWEIFARRGLGYFADQGDANDQDDGVENFEPLPTCIIDLKVRKSIDDLIFAGDQVEVTLDIANHTLETATNVLVSDMLPEGLSYLSGSGSIEASVNGDLLTFNVGDMASLEESQITYVLVSDPDNKSVSNFYDNMDGDISNWDLEILEGYNLWQLTSLEANSAPLSWFLDAPETETDQALIYKGLDVVGTNPVLRFYHKFNTEFGSDGGFLEISTDAGATWERISDGFILGDYNSTIQYGTFAIPSLRGFSGLQEEFLPSYLSLAKFAGENIWIKFRFGTDDNTTSTVTDFIPGWYVDDMQLIDLVQYETLACISSDEGNNVCAPQNSTIVDAQLGVAVEDLTADGYSMVLSPNPANDQVTVNINSEVLGLVGLIELKSVDGRILSSQKVEIINNETFINIDVNALTSGFYFVSLQSGDKVLTQKLMIN